jgi:hypothetical protein
LFVLFKSLIDVYIGRPGVVAPPTSSGGKRGKKAADATDASPVADDPVLITQLDDTIQGHFALHGGNPSRAAIQAAPAKKSSRVPPKRKFKFAPKDLAAQPPASPFSSGSEDSGDDLALAFRYKAEGKLTGVDASGLSAYWQPYTEEELRIIDIACIGIENGEEKQTHCIRRIAAELGRSENGVTTKLRDRLNYLRLARHVDPSKRSWTMADFAGIEDGKRPRGRPRKNYGSYVEGLLGQEEVAAEAEGDGSSFITAEEGEAARAMVDAVNAKPAAPARASRKAGKN